MDHDVLHACAQAFICFIIIIALIIIILSLIVKSIYVVVSMPSINCIVMMVPQHNHICHIVASPIPSPSHHHVHHTYVCGY